MLVYGSVIVAVKMTTDVYYSPDLSLTLPPTVSLRVRSSQAPPAARASHLRYLASSHIEGVSGGGIGGSS